MHSVCMCVCVRGAGVEVGRRCHPLCITQQQPQCPYLVISVRSSTELSNEKGGGNAEKDVGSDGEDFSKEGFHLHKMDFHLFTLPTAQTKFLA